MTKGEIPEEARREEGKRSCGNEVKHKKRRIAQRLDENARGNVGHDDDRDEPAKNEPEYLWVDDVRISRDVEKVEITVDQTLQIGRASCRERV